MIYYLLITPKYSNSYNHHHQQLSTSTEEILMLRLTASLCLTLSTGGLAIRNCKTAPLMVISSSISSLAATFAINLAVILKATVSAAATITAL